MSRIDTGKIIVSRHVVFNEGVFPYQTQDSTSRTIEEHTTNHFPTFQPALFPTPLSTQPLVHTDDDNTMK